MTNPNAFTIAIFLPVGADGPRVIEKSNWTGKAVACTRDDYLETRAREEFSGSGVYVLHGPTDDPARRRIYIGESDVARSRLNEHLKTKDFWENLVLFASKDGSLNKAHARYVEARLIGLAKLANRDEVENGTAPPVPKLAEAETAFAEVFLAHMLSIYPVLGLVSFEPLPDLLAEGPVFFLKGPGAEATGYRLQDTFVVKAGSTARAQAVPTMPSSYLALRDQLLHDGLLTGDGASLTLATDHVFNSVSAAAAVFLARSANGRDEWRDAAGHSIKELESAAVDDDLSTGVTA